MNPIFNYIILETIRGNRLKSQFAFRSGNRKMDKKIRQILHDIIFLFSGVMSATFGLKAFLLPNSFIDGGVTGISLLLADLIDFPFSLLLLLINIPFILLAFSTVNKSFALKSIVSIGLLSLSIYLIPFPLITQDKLLIAVFGGFFLGLGIGLAMRGGAVIDGTEILAIFLSKKSSLTIGDIILVFNVVIFSFASYVFSIEIALYAMLTYFSASRTVDFVVSGIEEYIGVTIISEKSEMIRLAIIEKMGRGCTLYSGKKGFAKRGVKLKEVDIIYTLLTRLEISKLKAEIAEIDEQAFVVMHSIKDVKGGMIKKRPLEV